MESGGAEEPTRWVTGERGEEVSHAVTVGKTRGVTIVGGGLAGLSLGIGLRKQGVEVKLIDAGKYPRHRVCGEFIAGVSADVLQELGIDEILSEREVKRHQAMEWWMGDVCVLAEKTPSVALGVSRYWLDNRLLAEFTKLGGEIELGRSVRFNELEGEGVVMAVGKLKGGNRVTQDRGKNMSDKQWIGLKIHAVGLSEEELAEMGGLVMHSGGEKTDRNRSGNGYRAGYMGLCPVEDGRVNCCGLFEVQSEITPTVARARWGDKAADMRVAMMMSYAEACGMTALLEWLQCHVFDADSFTAIAGFDLGEQREEGESDFCVGDAAYLIPPFTGNGMSMALESSAMAARSLVKYAYGSIEWDTAVAEYREESRQCFAKRKMWAKLVHPLFFHSMGQTVLRSVARSGFPSFHSLFQLLRTP